MKKLIVLFSLMATNTSISIGQDNTFQAYGGFNLLSYTGDMGSFDNTGAGFNAGVLFTKKEKLNGAISLGFGQISGDDPTLLPSQNADMRSPNQFFKTNFFFFNYELRYNILRRAKFKVFLSQGIGLFRFEPQDTNGESLIEQPSTRQQDEEYGNAVLMLPSSVGLYYNLSDRAAVAIQTGFMNTMTDYLDNISEFGSSGNDNIFFSRFSVYIPVNITNQND